MNSEMNSEALFGSALYNSAVYSDEEEEKIFGSPVGEARLVKCCQSTAGHRPKFRSHSSIDACLHLHSREVRVEVKWYCSMFHVRGHSKRNAADPDSAARPESGKRWHSSTSARKRSYLQTGSKFLQSVQGLLTSVSTESTAKSSRYE